MKAIKLTPKERELFEHLKGTPGGGITPAYQAIEHYLFSPAR